MPGRERPKRGKRERKSDEQLSRERKEDNISNWVPKTELGRKVLGGEVTSLEQIRQKNLPIMESQIIDYLMPGLEEKMVEFNKTTRVTRQGRQFSFRATVLIGDKDGHVGIGIGKDRERLPAIKKASNNAKQNIIAIKRGCGSWECLCNTKHTVPFKVLGKCSSVKIELIPAPKGVGLVAGKNIKDVLRLAGIMDIWCRSSGSTGTKLNYVKAAVNALENTTQMKTMEEGEN